MWHMYIIECKNNSLYTGITDNLRRRFKQHLQKTTHYTTYNPPVEIIYSEEFETRNQARIRERQIKKWTRAKKLALAHGKHKLLKEL